VELFFKELGKALPCLEELELTDLTNDEECEIVKYIPSLQKINGKDVANIQVSMTSVEASEGL
jgi:hypothetical protein